MLTKDTLRARVYKDQIRPSFIKVADAELLAYAGELIALFKAGLDNGAQRGELEQIIKDQIGLSRNAKLLNGIGRILLDRCVFEMRSPIDPKELRERLFIRSNALGPLSLSAGHFGHTTADDVFASVAADLNISPTAVRDAMFADRKDQAVLTKFRCHSAEWLLNRYNLALVQGVLLHCKKLTVELLDPTPARLRQILRYAKFYQLIHDVHRNGKLVMITLDGPTSVLRQSSRYGMALANFFPAVLLQPKTWSVQGDALWGKPTKLRTLSIDQSHHLKSHYPDTGIRVPQAAEWLADKFRALNSDWTIQAAKKPLRLGTSTVVMPDFTFTRAGEEIHMEILGYWRSGYLKSRLSLLSKHAPTNLILAISDRLKSDKTAMSELPVQVISYKGVIPAKIVLARLNDMSKT